MSSTTEPKKLHIALFPWLAFGHIIPFFEVAKHVARRGHKVSFISTPRNIQRLPKIPQHLTSLINLVQIQLPRVKNLPENAEATMGVPYHIIPYLKMAHDELEQCISNFLQTHKPNWIIHDFAPYWLPPIASSLGISRAHFSVFNGSSLCFYGPQGLDCYGVRTLPEQFTVPVEWIPFPSNMVLKSFEAKNLFDSMKQNASSVSDWFRVKSTVQGCQVYFIRSCRETEGEWLDLLQELQQKPVVPTGLMPPVVQAREDKEDWSTIAQWLDKKKKATVVYIALGSELNLSQQDFTELALGLELSGLPFFWALRKPSWSGNGGSGKLPDGFKDL
ncbi:hypothetical protein PRUPE_6G204000 [Prunus persica]|uniref:Uncharacterized protein n=2 Tax=Prunus persica TaxID=3760 RepID=A0A251NVU9_PRUPE|nr:hypothetical protein PRUPE_6G204000 [Prunus persica]